MTNSFDSALYAACVTAAGPAPHGVDEQAPWIARVNHLYTQLTRDRSRLATHLDLLARIEAPKETRERGFGIVTGTLVEVRDEHGRAVLTVEGDMGSGEFGPDVFRTDWLDDGGAEVAATARGLIGRRVRVWKYAEPHSKKPGQTVRMVAHIEPARGDASGAPSTAEAASTPPQPAAVVATEPVASATPADDAVEAGEPGGEAVLALDGTPLDDLRDRQPDGVRELRTWAAEYLGFDQDRVTQIARRILQASSGDRERTPAELRTVWRALLAHFVSERVPTAA